MLRDCFNGLAADMITSRGIIMAATPSRDAEQYRYITSLHKISYLRRRQRCCRDAIADKDTNLQYLAEFAGNARPH